MRPIAHQTLLQERVVVYYSVLNSTMTTYVDPYVAEKFRSHERSFVSEERRRVLSQGRQIEHQAGNGGSLAKTTRRAGALAAVAGLRARQHGQKL
jgi:hypothetical protein